MEIERYIWRSQDDAKVRDSHAEYDDRVFRWDEPPAGGHPGQAHNCRCYAEPVTPGSRTDVILAELTLPADSLPSGGGILRRLANGLLARSPAGIAAYAALEANNLLQGFVQPAREQRIQDAAAILGADLGTVEGLLAAQSYAQALVLAENGFLSGSPERGERARVIAEALGLYEMYRPGLFTLPNDNALEAVNLARRLAADALAALDAGRLVIDEGSLAQGWAAYPAELRERGVRLFRENRAEYASDTAAYKAIAPKLGCSPDSLRVWCQQAERDSGQRAGLTSAEKDQGSGA